MARRIMAPPEDSRRSKGWRGTWFWSDLLGVLLAPLAVCVLLRPDFCIKSVYMFWLADGQMSLSHLQIAGTNESPRIPVTREQGDPSFDLETVLKKR